MPKHDRTGRGVLDAARRQVVNRQPAELNVTFLVAALRRFPQWAVWLPRHGEPS
jgi:hypothetical protein